MTSEVKPSCKPTHILYVSIGNQLGTQREIYRMTSLILTDKEYQALKWFENEDRLHIMIRHANSNMKILGISRPAKISVRVRGKIYFKYKSDNIKSILDDLDFNVFFDSLMINSDLINSEFYQNWLILKNIFYTYGDDINIGRFEYANLQLNNLIEHSKQIKKTIFYKPTYDGKPIKLGEAMNVE